uniref:Uncharacterized protein n=1 Tax=Kalanchoe fedtschenkoi TaxID=63787 RepID=A0A7N0ZRU1_KALFE
MGCNKSKHAAVASGNTMKMAQRRPLTRIANNNNERIKKNNRTVPVEAMEEPSCNGNEGDVVKCSIPKQQAVNGVEKKQAPAKVENNGNGQKEGQVKRSGAPSSVVLSMEDVDKKAPLFEVEKVSSGADQKQVAGASSSAAVVEDVLVMENVEKEAPAEIEKVDNNNGVEEKEVEVEVSRVASASPGAVVEGETNTLELAGEATVEETAVVVELKNAEESGESDDAVGEADGAKQVVEEEADEGAGEVVVEEVNAEEDDAGAAEDEVDESKANEARNEGGEVAGEESVVEAENGGAAEEGRVETVAEEIELSNVCETIETVTAEDEELKDCREAAEEDSADANVAENAQPNCGGEAAIVVPESTEQSNTTFETVTVEEVKGEEANEVENGQSKCGGGEEAIAACDQSTDGCNVAASEVITEACSSSCANKEAEVVANRVEKGQFIGGGEAAAEVLVLDANVDVVGHGGEAEHEFLLEADEAETRESDGGADHAIKEPEAAAEVITAVKNGYGGEAVTEAEGQSGICSEEVKEATTTMDANKEENNGESETDVVVTEKSTAENGRSGSGGELAATEEVLTDAILVETETEQFNGSADVILETD